MFLQKTHLFMASTRDGEGSRFAEAADAPLCSEDSSKASGAHGVLLLTACLGSRVTRSLKTLESRDRARGGVV